MDNTIKDLELVRVSATPASLLPVFYNASNIRYFISALLYFGPQHRIVG